ncbi:MFS transporter [bacterium]|nr:MFS transporter [bacterium]
MSTVPTARLAALRENIRLYPWFSAAFNAYFWVPVFFLYFSARLPLSQVLALEAIYYGAVVILEIPSGYLSDRVGRRPTLLLAGISLVVAYALFATGSSFGAFALAQVALAMGIACNSGTDTSFHYDSLADLGRTEEFAAREAKVARLGFLAGAAAALLGGAVGVVDLRLAYVLSLVAALAALALALRFVEPGARARGDVTIGFGRQMAAVWGLLRDRALLWLMAFYILMTVVNHIPYEFYQPYLRLLAEGGAFPAPATPLAAGMHLAATMLIAAWVAGHSVRLRDRLGLGWALLAALALQLVVIAAMGSVLAAWVVPLMLLRSAPKGLMMAPLNAAIAPRVPRAQRATYLSLQSLLGRLAFAGVLGVMALAVGATVDWSSLHLLLRLGLLVGVAGGVLLLLGRRRAMTADGKVENASG